MVEEGKEKIVKLELEGLIKPGPQKENTIRMVCISDTHGHTTDLQPIPSGDILLHAGDFTNIGEMKDIIKFNEFLGQLPHKHKIIIPGNHDLLFDPHDFKTKRMFKTKLKPAQNTPQMARSLLTNCIYLQDSACQVFGYKFYGTPWQPVFCDWAFNLNTEEELGEKWDLIPSDTDVLLVHGPPYSIGDVIKTGKSVGSKGLLTTIQERVKPLLAVFGHIHEDYGAWSDGTTTYFNASMLDFFYKPIFNPLVIDLPTNL